MKGQLFTLLAVNSSDRIEGDMLVHKQRPEAAWGVQKGNRQGEREKRRSTVNYLEKPKGIILRRISIRNGRNVNKCFLPYMATLYGGG